ncbi:hypothetical protein pb186bvf_004951 [Paramecium bursaria]
MKKGKSANEPDMLIESMQKLIDHMNDNKTHQEEIFQSLNHQDVFKILQNFEDPNSSMRKTSACFLCELVYDNPVVQKGFCEITNILPIDGKICVNKIPQNLMLQGRNLPQIFEAIKNAPIPFDQDQNYPLCWYYEIQRGTSNWKAGVKFIKFEKSSTNAKQRISNFIDPQNHLFGFIIGQKSELLKDQSKITQRATSNKSVNESNQTIKKTQVPPKMRPQSGYSPLTNSSPSPMMKKKMLNTSLDYESMKQLTDDKNTFSKTYVDSNGLSPITEAQQKKTTKLLTQKTQPSTTSKRFK